MIGIDSNWKQDVFFGVGIGILFILGNMLAPNVINLGFPSWAMDAVFPVSLFLVIFVAPVFEEFAFRGVLPLVLISVGIKPIIADLMQAGAFSLFHWFVYGLGASAAFIGAFIFGFAARKLAERNNSLMTPIAAHSVFNAWLTKNQFIIVGA